MQLKFLDLLYKHHFNQSSFGRYYKDQHLCRDLTVGPVIEIPCFHSWGHKWRTKILHAVWCGQKNPNKPNKQTIKQKNNLQNFCIVPKTALRMHIKNIFLFSR